jgi:hypothetical protein
VPIRLARVFRQTDPMNCWFYAAKTIVWHRTNVLLMEADYRDFTASCAPGRGPVSRLPMGRCTPIEWWMRYGLPQGDVREFQSRFGFERLGDQPATWSIGTLTAALTAYGPLWFAGRAGSFGHVVVLTGVDAVGTVTFGDPATGQVSQDTLANFNSWKQQTLGLPNPLFYPIP